MEFLLALKLSALRNGSVSIKRDEEHVFLELVLETTFGKKESMEMLDF